MFEFVEEGKNVQKAKCKLCGNIYSAKSKVSTGRLLRHRQKHLALHKPVDAGARGPVSQTQISTTAGSSSSLSLFYFNAQNARQHLVKMIVLSELPFFYFLFLFFC